jgi:hypothetical protein
VLADESIAGMAEETDNRSPFSWADTPWTVAALLGAWGVFLGAEEFFLANVFMVLAGASCTFRLYKDSIAFKPRKKGAFVLGLAIVVVIVAVDIHLTDKKKESSEKKSQEIPKLTAEIGNLQQTINEQRTALATAQGQANQKLFDISQQNADLKKSVDTKDAALVAIAKEQYALNFFPQVYVATFDSKDEVKVSNNGKTNIEVYGYKIDSQPPKIESPPLLIVPGANTGYKINDYIVKTALPLSRNPVPLECVVYL